MNEATQYRYKIFLYGGPYDISGPFNTEQEAVGALNERLSMSSEFTGAIQVREGLKPYYETLYQVDNFED